MTDEIQIPKINFDPPFLPGGKIEKKFVRRKLTEEEKFRARHMEKCWECFCLTSSHCIYRCRHCIERGIPIPAKFSIETKSGS